MKWELHLYSSGVGYTCPFGIRSDSLRNLRTVGHSIVDPSVISNMRSTSAGLYTPCMPIRVRSFCEAGLPTVRLIDKASRTALLRTIGGNEVHRGHEDIYIYHTMLTVTIVEGGRFCSAVHRQAAIDGLSRYGLIGLGLHGTASQPARSITISSSKRIDGLRVDPTRSNTIQHALTSLRHSVPVRSHPITQYDQHRIQLYLAVHTVWIPSLPADTLPTCLGRRRVV